MDQVLERARSGDAAALDAILSRVAPSVHRFARHMCRNAADADDVLQDTLLSVAQHLAAFEGRSSLSSWVFTLARSACAHRRRGLKNRPAEGEEAYAHAASMAQSPEDNAVDAELSMLVTRALDGLPEDYREVIVLRDVEGLDSNEVAATLGLSIEALKSRLHRARKALRDALQPVLEPAGPRPSPTCPDILSLWSAKLEDDLHPDDCARMEQHLAGCPGCGAVCDALRSALRACRQSATEEVDPVVRDRIRSALLQWNALPKA